MEITSENFSEKLLESMEQALAHAKGEIELKTTEMENKMTKIPETGNYVVKFGALWCGPCRTLKPIIEELSKEYEDSVEFLDLDVDEERELAETYGVRGIPATFFIKDGIVQGQLTGMHPKEEFIERIDKLVE